MYTFSDYIGPTALVLYCYLALQSPLVKVSVLCWTDGAAGFTHMDNHWS